MSNLKYYFRHLKNRWVVLTHDLIMIPIAWLGAYWLRYNLGEIPAHFFDQAILLLPLVITVQGIVFVFFGLYRGVWRFASVPDLARIVKAVIAGTAIVAISIFFLTRLLYVPRTVFVFYGLLLPLLLGGPRFLYRLVKDREFGATLDKKALVVGAGAAGEMLVRDLLRNSPKIYHPVGFLDDDRRKLGKEIHGVRVIGTTEGLSQIVEEWAVDLILLAVPSATAQQMRRIVEKCEQSGVPFRTLPKIQDLLRGDVDIGKLREVQIDDLLGREPVSLDWQAIRSDLKGKSILVSGGGGSIGAELCRQIARLEPDALIIFEQSEFNLYSTELELRRVHPDLNLHACLGDVCDAAAVQNVFETHAPDIVFHAAAYKHVPMLEHQVREAVRNNVFGSRNVANQADRSGCETFVMISTDKAVNPHNIMGVTKRVAEIYSQTLGQRSKTRFITVRFGNVLGSAGSVIPLFQNQIAAGGPVTVTDPEVTRYFMTISEASQLILQASVMGQGGEIYVLDMGEPIKIAYLAEQLIRLSGRSPNDDIEIVFTGLRPGEKRYEELFHPDEETTDTGHAKILLAKSRDAKWDWLSEHLQTLESACSDFNEDEILRVIHALVPEKSSPVGDSRSSVPNLVKQA